MFHEGVQTRRKDKRQTHHGEVQEAPLLLLCVFNYLCCNWSLSWQVLTKETTFSREPLKGHPAQTWKHAHYLFTALPMGGMVTCQQNAFGVSGLKKAFAANWMRCTSETETSEFILTSVDFSESVSYFGKSWHYWFKKKVKQTTATWKCAKHHLRSSWDCKKRSKQT